MYRDDAEAARQRIAVLEGELAELRRENEALRRGRPAPRRIPAVAVVGAVVIAIGGTVAWASAASRAGSPRLRPRAPEPSAPALVAPAAADIPLESASSMPGDAPIAVAPADEDARTVEIAAALEPGHPDVIEVLAAREHGRQLFVLHRWLGAAAWRHAREEAGTLDQELADYEDRRTICEDGAEDDVASTRCAIEEAPDRWLGLEDAVCERAQALEVAHLEREGDRWTVRARRRLIEAACDPGAGREPEIRAADLDRDGRAEITVIAPFQVPSVLLDQLETVALGAVLDSGDLHAQLVVLRDYDASYGDEETVTRTVATTWNLDDRDGDGTVEAHLRQRIADVDDFGRSTDARTADCPYDAARDRWACAEAWALDPLAAAISGTDLEPPPVAR